MDAKNMGGAGALLGIITLAALILLFRRLWLWLLIVAGGLAAAAVALLVVMDRHYKKKNAGRPAGPGGQAPAAGDGLPNVMRHYYNIHDPDMKQIMKDIDAERRKMIRNAADDPRDRSAAGRFLRTALTGACRIAEGYARLEKAPQGAHEAEAAMRKAKESMRFIAQAFAQQNVRLFENDILHLEVETEVLDKTLRAQGYQPEPPAAAPATGKESEHE